MPSVRNFELTYDALNEYGTFSEGDVVAGTVSLTAEKDITVQTLFVKLKGDANVHWTHKSGDRTHSYSDHRRYFKEKQVLIPESTKDTPVSQGSHVFKFRFTIPGNIPPSYRANHGKIVYQLEAVLSRSWRLNRTVEKEIILVSRFYPDLNSLMSQQELSTNKDMGLFSKANVHMDVVIGRKVYAPGDKMKIVAKVNNSSSRDMMLKASLTQEVVYRANNHSKREDHVICKVVGEGITPETQAEVKCEIPVPPDQIETIHNCDILSVHYYLKVYLDISFAFDPEVKMPVIILPYNLVHGQQPGLPAGPCPAGGFGGPTNSDFPAPGTFGGPYPPGGFGAPTNSDFPPPSALAGPCPAGGFGGPASSTFPPPGAIGGPYPPGGFGGPANSGFPAPAVPGGSCPASPHSGYYGYSPVPRAAGPNYPAVRAGPPAAGPPQPPDMRGSYTNPAPPQASPYRPASSSSSSSSAELHPRSYAPALPPPTSATDTQPPSYSMLFDTSVAPPSYNLLPSAPVMSMDFLSLTDDAPPAYSVPSLPSDAKQTESKEQSSAP